MGDAPRIGPTLFIGWCMGTALLGLTACALPPMDGLVLAAVFAAVAVAYSAAASRTRDVGPMLLFALTSFLFVWARPLIAAISSEFDLDIIEAMGGVSVSRAGQAAYLRAVACSMIAFATTIAFLLATPVEFIAPERGMPGSDDQPGSRGRGFWITLFVLGAAASVVQAALYARHFLRGGSYFELFVLGKDSVTFPGLSLLGSSLFLGYVGLLTFAPLSPGGRKRAALLFGVLSVTGLARGSRGEVFAQLLVGIWVYFFVSNRRPKLRFWGLILAGLVVVAETISVLRAGVGFESHEGAVMNQLAWFVYSQGISGELVGAAYDEFGVGLGNVRFLLAPLLAPIRQLFDPGFGTQTDAYGQSSGLLAHELAYRVDPTLYLLGQGMGSSYLAESHAAFGLVGVIAATSALIWILGTLPGRARLSGPTLFLFACALPYALFVPRESLLFFVVPVLKAALVLVVHAKFQKARYGGRADVQSGAPA